MESLEDGTVQAVLQTMNIPYSGCGPLSSAVCMDKDMTKGLKGIRNQYCKMGNG